MLTGFAWRCHQGFSAGLPEKALRRSIILVCILSQRCPRLVPHNYSECDCVAGFGISETQTRSELPSRLSFQLPPLSLSLSFPLYVCFALSSFTTYRMEELARRCFKGSGPFSLFTSVAVQMLLRDLGNSSHPAPFQTAGGGDDQHSPHLAVTNEEVKKRLKTLLYDVLKEQMVKG